MAYKVFSNGNALNASELNTYLMNQSVISFASTTARDAALTAPVEGQLVWLEDSNKYVYYTGSAWADLISAASFPSGNAIINGGFDINQRAFTSTTSGGYGFDRWKNGQAGGTVTYSAQVFTPGTAPVAGYESKNFARVVTSGHAGASDYSVFQQVVEDARTFAGQTATYSFWAKAASGTPKVALEIIQDFGTGGSPSTAVQTYAGQVTLTTSWARYSITVAVPSISGKTFGTSGDSLSMNLWMSAGTTFNARTGSLGVQNNTFDVWGFQLESGSSATTFKRNASSLQAELEACQRYAFNPMYENAAANTVVCAGYSVNTTTVYALLVFPVTMRTQPSLTVTASSFGVGYSSGAAGTASALVIQVASTSNALLGVTSSGLSGNNGYQLFRSGTSAPFILSAEF